MKDCCFRKSSDGSGLCKLLAKTADVLVLCLRDKSKLMKKVQIKIVYFAILLVAFSLGILY